MAAWSLVLCLAYSAAYLPPAHVRYPVRPRRLAPPHSVASSAAAFGSSAENSASAQERSLRVLYDGTCKVCLTNVALLGWLDKNKQRLQFVNIASKSYLPEANGGVAYEDAMRHIHVIDERQQVLKGADGVLAAYGAVGLGWFVALLRLPVLRWVIAALYAVVSRYRQAISRFLPGGRQLSEFVSSLKEVGAAAQGEGCDDEEECLLPYDDEEEE